MTGRTTFFEKFLKRIESIFGNFLSTYKVQRSKRHLYTIFVGGAQKGKEALLTIGGIGPFW